MTLIGKTAMKALALAVLGCLAFVASPLLAQDDDSGGAEIIVSGMRNSLSGPALTQQPPVIGLKRMADSAVRTIAIVSDSREEAMRRREVQAMLLDAIDRAKRDGFSLVTGQFELVEVTRANWQNHFPALAEKGDSTDEDANVVQGAFQDTGNLAIVQLKVKTKLDGSIGSAQQKINAFVKSVPATGRSQIQQKGQLALTIINPEQYRDEIYRRIATGSQHAVTFYGPDYGLDVTGLDKAIAWKQVSNTEVFLYIPYQFAVRK